MIVKSFWPDMQCYPVKSSIKVVFRLKISYFLYILTRNLTLSRLNILHIVLKNVLRAMVKFSKPEIWNNLIKFSNKVVFGLKISYFWIFDYIIWYLIFWNFLFLVIKNTMRAIVKLVWSKIESKYVTFWNKEVFGLKSAIFEYLTKLLDIQTLEKLVITWIKCIIHDDIVSLMRNVE